MYVYIVSEPGLFTVGFYKPDGTWEPESDYATREEAATQVHYLNGGKYSGDIRATIGEPHSADSGGWGG